MRVKIIFWKNMPVVVFHFFAFYFFIFSLFACVSCKKLFLFYFFYFFGFSRVRFILIYWKIFRNCSNLVLDKTVRIDAVTSTRWFDWITFDGYRLDYYCSGHFFFTTRNWFWSWTSTLWYSYIFKYINHRIGVMKCRGLYWKSWKGMDDWGFWI